MNCLESVFADLDISLSTIPSEEKAFVRPKRSAFVFITTEIDAAHLAFDDLKHVEGVNEVYLSRGAYDIIARVSAESMETLREIIFQRIKNLSSIKSTLTLTVI